MYYMCHLTEDNKCIMPNSLCYDMSRFDWIGVRDPEVHVEVY